MQDPAQFIAVSVLLLYAILGPLVLFAIYVLFDSLSKPGRRPDTPQQDKAAGKKDPALWTSTDIDNYINRI